MEYFYFVTDFWAELYMVQISLKTLQENIKNMSSSTRPVNNLPASLLREFLPTGGPNILSVTNSSLNTGSSLTFHYSLGLPLKKPNPDPSVLLSSPQRKLVNLDVVN